MRRTYARQLYLTGTDLTAIQQNMGHSGQDITLGYIGTLDARQREPGDVYGTAWLRSLWDTLAVPTDIVVEDEDVVFDHASTPTLDHGGYVFKIVLADVRPQVWRRFKVPAGITFHTLHDIIQAVMGWENYHIYRFTSDLAAFTMQPMASEDRSSSERIDGYLTCEGQQLFYEYDFGDLWGHVLTLEKTLSRPVITPHCIAGNWACPPEDSGGPWIYSEFLHSRRSRKGRVSRKWQHRMGNYWDADAFDLDVINATLQSEWQNLNSP